MRKFLCIKDMYYIDHDGTTELGFICGNTYTECESAVVIDESGEENIGFGEDEKEWVDEYFVVVEG